MVTTPKLNLPKPVPNVEKDWGLRLNEGLDILDDTMLTANVAGAGTVTITDDGSGNVTISGTAGTGGTDTVSDALVGADGITVISGVPTASETTISGFRTEFVSSSGSLQTQIDTLAPLTVKETDGSPLVTNVNTIIVTTGTLTDDGGGQVTIVTGGGGGGGSALTVKETDGSPTVNNVTTIVVTTGTLTDDGGGQVTLDTGGSGGGGGGTIVTSGTYLLIDAKPTNPHAKSDWFDDNSTNPDLLGDHAIDATKWTLWDVDTVSSATTGNTVLMRDGDGTALDTNNMQVGHDGSTTGGWVGFFQDAPSGDFTITARIGAKGIFSSTTNFRFGIFVADDLAGSPSTSDLHSKANVRDRKS